MKSPKHPCLNRGAFKRTAKEVSTWSQIIFDSYNKASGKTDYLFTALGNTMLRCSVSTTGFYRSIEKKLRSHERSFIMKDYTLPFKFALESITEEHKIISRLLFTLRNFFINLLSVPSLGKAVDCSYHGTPS